MTKKYFLFEYYWISRNPTIDKNPNTYKFPPFTHSDSDGLSLYIFAQIILKIKSFKGSKQDKH